MDYLNAGLELGTDLVFLGLCIREYFTCKRHINLLKAAPELAIDSTLKEYVKQALQQDNKLPYVAIQGAVTPLDKSIPSIWSSPATVALQIIRIIEHRASRGLFGLWYDKTEVIHNSIRAIPFELRCNNVGVQIPDALSHSILDLDMVHNNYEPKSLSLLNQICGYFAGTIQNYQTTEEILPEGSIITAIGQLQLDNDTLQLQSSAGLPIFLTTLDKSNLLEKIEHDKNSALFKIFFYGTISAFAAGVILRKMYVKRKQEYEKRCRRLQLEQQLAERGACSNSSNLPAGQTCVVCLTNPKEVIFLPCGHVCTCKDCSVHIESNCPVCRAEIDMRAAAYIS